jgi:hypothetical protein
MLYVAYPNQAQRYYDIDQLPLEVHTKLLQRFESLRSGSVYKQDFYRTLCNNCPKFKDRKFCVGD